MPTIDILEALKLVSALLCCSLSLSLTFSSIVTSQQQNASLITELARLLSPSLVLLSGSIGSATCLSTALTSSPTTRRHLQIVQHSAAIVAILLIVAGFSMNYNSTITSPNNFPTEAEQQSNMNQSMTESDALTSQPAPSNKNLVSIIVGLIVIALLTCQTVLCWLASRDLTTSAAADSEAILLGEQDQLQQHQRQLDSLKPIAGGRIGAANRRRRPPTAAAAASPGARGVEQLEGSARDTNEIETAPAQ